MNETVVRTFFLIFASQCTDGWMSTCRFGGAEGTDERVLALNTNVCRVQEETREVTAVEEGHDVERVVETKW